MPLDLPALRQQFPILHGLAGNHPLIYLDNAATTHKPQVVLDALDRFYRADNGNVHRGMHGQTERATAAYEHARSVMQQFLHAEHSDEIIFTKSTTESINLVARSYGRTLQSGDVVVLTVLEHHSNIVPWLQLKEEKNIELCWVDCDDGGNLNLTDLDRFLAEKRVKLVTVTGQSNVLGTRPDLRTIIAKAHAAGALVCIDAAQLIGHSAINVAELDCDFLAFSGHKLYGPTGIGVLYGKRALLKEMPPFLGGGMMVGEVFPDHFTCADPPQKFEAGTPPIAGAVGLAAAIDWLSAIPIEDRAAHEDALLQHAAARLKEIPGLHLLGPWSKDLPLTAYRLSPSSILSFTLSSLHPHDLTDLLGKQGICLRAGHHCAQPLHRRLGIPASTRLSLALYNTEEEIDRAVQAIKEIQKTFH